MFNLATHWRLDSGLGRESVNAGSVMSVFKRMELQGGRDKYTDS